MLAYSRVLLLKGASHICFVFSAGHPSCPMSTDMHCICWKGAGCSASGHCIRLHSPDSQCKPLRGVWCAGQNMSLSPRSLVNVSKVVTGTFRHAATRLLPLRGAVMPNLGTLTAFSLSYLQSIHTLSQASWPDQSRNCKCSLSNACQAHTHKLCVLHHLLMLKQCKTLTTPESATHRRFTFQQTRPLAMSSALRLTPGTH